MGTKPARVLLSTRGEQASDQSNVDFVLAQERVKEIIATILKEMNIAFTGITTALITGRLLVEIDSADSKWIIGKNGQTLDALEHIVNLMLHADEKTRVKVNIDTEKYRAHQEERLQSIAQKAADQVRRTGKMYRFDPMTAKERRVVHLYLKTEPDIETYSEGEGNFRKVVVKPKKDK
jgi:spoIIIJ-associated protein